MVEFGMSPLQAIQSTTIVNARLFGLEDQIGRIAPGYRADLIGVAENLLDDVQTLERVAFVMKDGRVFRQP